jgi:hypothetical protein
MDEPTAIAVIQELREPQIFKKGTSGSKLNLKVTVITLDTMCKLKATALLDSGCEGSCIDIDFVQENKLPTTHLP